MEEEVKKSKYNSAVSKEIRRSEIWKEANTHSRNGLYTKWNEDLDCIWRELCADLKEKFTDKQTEFKKFETDLFNAGNIIDTKKGFTPLTKEQLDSRNKHYKILNEKEIWLRKLENELGKGTVTEDEDEDEF